MKKLSNIDWSKQDAKIETPADNGMKKLNPAQMGTVNGGGKIMKN